MKALEWIKIIGWALMILGGIPFALLGANCIAWLIDSQPPVIHIPTLVVGLIVFVIGFVIKELKLKVQNKK